MSLQIWLVLFVTTLLSFQNRVVGRNWKLSKREDLELERQLKRLNKPAIKTIHMEHGDIYDCIDFYQQPAFNHPLLKNHTYKFEKETSPLHNETNLSEFYQNFDLKDEECPTGTVIIKRLTKEDLIRERLASNRKVRRVVGPYPDTHTAGVRTMSTQDRFTGAAADLGIYNPEIYNTQYSAARIVISNGLDRLEVGWRVDPWLHHDYKTHIYIHTDASKTDSHCFGTACAAFVVTSNKISVNSYFKDNISRKNVVDYVFPVEIYQDQATGNWKLQVGRNRIELGYWPKVIFSESGLQEWASYIEWGAEVYCPPNNPKTVMGYGSRPNYNEGKLDNAYINNLAYSENYQIKDAIRTEAYADSEMYKVLDYPTGFDADNVFRHIFFYGGPDP